MSPFEGIRSEGRIQGGSRGTHNLESHLSLFKCEQVFMPQDVVVKKHGGGWAAKTKLLASCYVLSILSYTIRYSTILHPMMSTAESPFFVMAKCHNQELGLPAVSAAGTAIVMNSNLLHCGGANLPDAMGGGRRRLFYVTWLGCSLQP